MLSRSWWQAHFVARDWQHAGFGVYVHWPFCQAKCPYCDFNSHVTDQVNHQEWCSALLSELRNQAAHTPNRRVDTIFFGGGTPSLMHPDTVASIIEDARAAWPQVNDIEITLEANPTSVEATKFHQFRDAGINRVSIGIQALNDPDLKALGRLHTAAEAMDAFDVARTTFGRVSFDLIYARQNQSLADWESERAWSVSKGDSRGTTTSIQSPSTWRTKSVSLPRSSARWACT